MDTPSLSAQEEQRPPPICNIDRDISTASTAIWTFGANIMRNDLGFADGRIALAWSVLGAAGLVGAGTGLLTLRFGIGPVHRFALLVMALALIGLTAATLAPMMTFGVSNSKFA